MKYIGKINYYLKSLKIGLQDEPDLLFYKEKFKTKATNLFELTLTEDEKNKMEAFLQKKFSDKAGAEKLVSMLY